MQTIFPLTSADFLNPVQRMKWRLEVHDGSAWQDTTALNIGDFDPLRPWLDWDWSSRKLFALPIPTANLTDFPNKVPIVAGSPVSIAIGAACRADGFDIRFTAADGVTLLSYEREAGFAVVGGEASGIFWVKSDVATAGTYIWCYYGNAAAPDVSNGPAVFGPAGSNHAAVYHMNDLTTSTILDSTGNGNDGAKKGANEPIEAAGAIAKGQDFDGADDYINISGNSLNAVTPFSVGVSFKKHDTDGVNQILIGKDDVATYEQYFLGWGGNVFYFSYSMASHVLSNMSHPAWNANVIDDGWHRVVGVWDGTQHRLYADGVEVNSQTSAQFAYTDARHAIGRYGFWANWYFDGVEDEARITHVAPSAAWIAYEYANMNPADGGLTWGAEETAPTRDYLKSVSISLGGAGLQTAPIAGTWSAILDNKDGIFHPYHPTSPYKSLLRLGREVRISVGGNYGGVDTYWQRLIGFMDAPRFVHGTHEVEIGGMDYMKLLADTRIGESPLLDEAESASGSPSGSDELPGEVTGYQRGPSRWGQRVTFDSKAGGGGMGTEIYAEADACEIGAGEANNVTNWTGGGVSSELGEKSDYCLRLTRIDDGPDEEYGHNVNCGSIEAGKQYTIGFWTHGVPVDEGYYGYGRVRIYQTVGGAAQAIGTVTVNANSDWAHYQAVVSCTSAGAVQLRLSSFGVSAKAGDIIELDEISIQVYEPDTWNVYELPAGCNGPYFVTLNNGDGLGAVPIWQGDDADDKQSWTYEESTRLLRFTKDLMVNAGTDNLHIYYYTAQVVEDVLADLLVHAGLYGTRATALADMDYTPTE